MWLMHTFLQKNRHYICAHCAHSKMILAKYERMVKNGLSKWLTQKHTIPNVYEQVGLSCILIQLGSFVGSINVFQF